MLLVVEKVGGALLLGADLYDVAKRFRFIDWKRQASRHLHDSLSFKKEYCMLYMYFITSGGSNII